MLLKSIMVRYIYHSVCAFRSSNIELGQKRDLKSTIQRSVWGKYIKKGVVGLSRPYQPSFNMFFELFAQSESGGSVALVRLDDVSVRKLVVAVGRPDNLTGLIVGNGQGSEAVGRIELAAPA